MSSTAVIGFGATLTIGAAVGNVLDIKGPSIKVDSLDITSNSSESEGFKEFMPGLADGGEISFDVLYGKTAYNTLFGYLRTMKTACTLAASDGGTWGFDCFITDLDADIPVQKEVKASLKVKISGPVTYSAGS